MIWVEDYQNATHIIDVVNHVRWCSVAGEIWVVKQPGFKNTLLHSISWPHGYKVKD